MPKIYLLKDFGDINNGFYVNDKYLDPDPGACRLYYIEESVGFQGSEDVIVAMVGVC